MTPTLRPTRGLTLVEVLIVLLVLIVLMGLTLPIIKATTCDDLKNVSISNLGALNVAHAMYAADWDDRQFTLARDDLGQYGFNTNTACEELIAAGDCHPPVILGEDCDGITRGFFFGCDGQDGSCAEFFAVPPINFPGHSSGGTEGLGSFRLPNARGFHEYVNGRFFDPTFYAPKDAPVYEQVLPLFDEDCEFVNVELELVFSSSYALSPAAMYHPDVLSLNPDIGGYYWRSPYEFAEGFESPTVSQATYAAQKRRMIEHNWLQNPPVPCNDVFPGCVPYYFNHGFNSVPMTLFFDGHVNGLSPHEAMRSDARSLAQTDGEIPLWSRDTPFGKTGYLIDNSWDMFAPTSYHILTVDGIRGRNTLE
jgi:hypothetical protein